ncbi:hypothetical protein [Streptomyces sp. NPDC091377]|uniref:hypothetical protein n=1 Tax=Streptomyces sp. NPDC091377 TaxID=3365995 RepID=UPI00383B0F88
MNDKPKTSQNDDPLAVMGQAAAGAADASRSDAERAADASLVNLLADHFKSQPEQGNS